ncbi:MAG: cation:proton antiporter, partial [Planctomycetota bacterium]
MLPSLASAAPAPLAPLVALAAIGFAGVAAQWTAWRLRLPSILLLLVVGLALGPGLGVVEPRALFGAAFDPAVSLAVAVILFEGGLTLKLEELDENASVIARLLTIGVLVTWGLATAAAHLLGGLPIQTALVLGAILTVTGPTVIGPLLRQVRPRGPAEPVAKWEGIVVDVVGATLAVLVLHAVVEGAGAGAGHTLEVALLDLGRTALVGTAVGAASAWALGLALRRHLIPDELESPLALGVVLLAFAGADTLAHESGLLAVTLMGFLLANRSDLSVHHIVEFKENLRVLLISTLFIVLAASVEFDAVLAAGWRGVAFVVALILVVRPACVLASTLGTGLPMKERAFLSMLAPRGIVAAAVSSLFALRLEEAAVPGAELMAPMAFMVIIGTVAFYGLSAGPIARRLGISDPDAQGTLIAGAGPFARELERALRSQGIDTLLVDSNRAAVRAARMDGARALRGSILSSRFVDDLPLGGTGRFIGLTGNDEVNALAAAH